MAKANETQSNTTGSLYRVNYSYVANNGALRGGAIVVTANSAQEAWNTAEEKLRTFSINHFKVTNAKLY